MTIMKTDKLTGPAVWKGADIAADDGWIYHLTEADIAGLEVMLASVEAQGLSLQHLTRDHVSLGPVASRLDAIAHDLEHGLGFSLMRGLPVERYTEEQLNIVYYAMGLYMGQPVTQNPKGDLLGLVMHVGDASKKDTRVYETNLYLPYHTDPSDVVALL